MSYIWNEYGVFNKFEIEDHFFSQFLEAGPKIGNYVGVNPLIRFANIFDKWMEDCDELVRDGVISENDKKGLENLCFHFLALLDRKCGIHLCSVEEYKLEKSIEVGEYGEKIRECYAKLHDHEKKIILKWLRKYGKTQGRLLFFNDILLEIFPGCRYYYNKTDKNYIVYLPYDKSEFNINVFDIVKILFLDITASVRDVWWYHFGIIGQDDTMRIDNIAIY